VRPVVSRVVWVAWTCLLAGHIGRAQALHEPVPSLREPSARVLGSQAGRARTGTASPFDAGTSTLETAGVLWVESWNKNLATDRLLGGHVALAHTWARNWQALLEIELLRSDLALSQDAFLIAGSGFARRRLWRFSRNDVYVEAGVGLAAATAPVPTRGTTFNYLIQGGGGLVSPVAARWSIVVGLRVWHLSNGGTIKGNSRNPDIEAIGGYAGLQWHLVE
jgi:hypothetical protein